jgi:hypothetical protein
MIPLILLILSVLDFALGSSANIREMSSVRRCGGRTKEVITVLGKRGDELEWMEKLFESFDRWWGEIRVVIASSAIHPPSRLRVQHR